MPSKPRVIYWFRTDLRLHDSPALKAALDLKPECLYPIWCWDPHYVYRARVGPNRWQFLLDCQSDLSSSITKLNSKSRLFVVREGPQTVLVKLFKAWRISHLVFEKDTDAYARERDADVIRQAEEAGVEVVVRMGRTLYDPDELVAANGGKPTMSITQVQRAAEKLKAVSKPLPAPSSLPDPGDININFDQTQPSSAPDLNDVQRSDKDTSYNQLAGPNQDFAVPAMSELGLKPASSTHRGGEANALAALDALMKNKSYVATFSKPATAPTAFSPQSTTLLSPHHHFGSLSVRLFYWRIMETLESFPKGKQSTIPTNLIGQLLFRDMYFGAQAPLGHFFGQVHGNSHCRFIPWHLPSTLSDSGISTGSYHIDDPQAEDWFQRWKFGKTGFPWIDALMRQLRQEGWIHHLGRHAVACFLTRGGCYISWERGADVFSEWLVDHEVACNAGNWMWLSCSAFYAQFYRCYSPVAFPKKTDPKGDFVRHYCPELKHYPDKYIYEPWKAPIADQKQAGCLIKDDGNLDHLSEPAPPRGSDAENGGMHTYPKPMFDFAARREICINAIKHAYHINLYGNDPKVLDGTWRKLFPDEADRFIETSSSPKSDINNAKYSSDNDTNGIRDRGKKGGIRHTTTSGNQGGDPDAGNEPDGGEAAEVGGETRGGDRVDNPAKKRKRGGGQGKGRGQAKGQGTLDEHFGGDGGEGGGKGGRKRRR